MKQDNAITITVRKIFLHRISLLLELIRNMRNFKAIHSIGIVLRGGRSLGIGGRRRVGLLIGFPFDGALSGPIYALMHAVHKAVNEDRHGE